MARDRMVSGSGSRGKLEGLRSFLRFCNFEENLMFFGFWLLIGWEFRFLVRVVY